MTEKKFLIPRNKDTIVRDFTDMSILPLTGAMKNWTGPEGRFWRRRVKDGCVYIGNPPENKKTKTSEAINDII